MKLFFRIGLYPSLTSLPRANSASLTSKKGQSERGKVCRRAIGGEGGILFFLKGVDQGAGVLLFTDCRDLNVVRGLGEVAVRSGGACPSSGCRLRRGGAGWCCFVVLILILVSLVFVCIRTTRCQLGVGILLSYLPIRK